MFVSKRKYDLDILQIEMDKDFLNSKLSFYQKELIELQKVINTNECNHKFNKWKQVKMDLSDHRVYKDKQVRRCKKCGFMESKEI